MEIGLLEPYSTGSFTTLGLDSLDDISNLRED